MLEWVERISEGDCKLAAGIALAGRLPARYILKSELKVIRGFNGSNRGARLDLAVLERATGRIVLVIETKRSPGSSATAQGERYSKLVGARTIYLRGMKACEGCAELVLSSLPPG